MSNDNSASAVRIFLETASKTLHDVSKRSPLVKLSLDKSVVLKKRTEIKKDIDSILRLEIATSTQRNSANISINTMFIAGLDSQTKSLVNSLMNRAKERFRERDFQTLHLLFGTIKTDEIHAPLLLLRVRLTADKGRQTYYIERHGTIEVNPALIRIMDETAIDSSIKNALTTYQESIEDIELTRSSAAVNDRLSKLAEILSMTFASATIDKDQVLLANLTFQNDLIIHDIDTIIKAISKDNTISLGSLQNLLGAPASYAKPHTPWTQQALRRIYSFFNRLRTSRPQAVDPITQFLILNSDSSQRKVISDVLNGESICVQGPPGTGKSQTIANMISVLIANKKRVLFVAEKETAINAVTKHLDGLKNLYLNANESTTKKKFDEDQIGKPFPSDIVDETIKYHDWKEYLDSTATIANDIQRWPNRTIYGKRQLLIDHIESVFTAHNAETTLFWEEHIKPLIHKPSIKHFGIWGFWHIWGYWYVRTFLSPSIERMLNQVKHVPVSSQPDAIIRSLPLGVRDITEYLYQHGTTNINIDDIVRYHLQRLFVSKQLPYTKLSQLKSKLEHPPEWALGYYERKNGMYHYHPNTYAINMVFQALKPINLTPDDAIEQTPPSSPAQKPVIIRSKDLVPCVITTPSKLKRFFGDVHAAKFDVVIIDEASQMRPESAIGAFFRAKQYVVFGDEKQLPPTSFGMAYTDDDNADIERSANYLTFKEKTGESALSWASKISVAPQLEFFYRGSEQLISASNTYFYNGKIKSFPKADASPITHHVINPSTDKKSTDDAIFAKVEELCAQALEKQQKTLVIASGKERKQALERYVRDQNSLSGDVEFTSIEEVQGNEAECVIFFFDHPEMRQDGNINLQKLGPINNEGGERRLNVAFTRAQKEMHIVTSFGAHQIDTSSDKVAHKFLKRFLEVASSDHSQSYTSSKKVMAWEQHFAAVIGGIDPSIQIHHSYGSSEQPITWAVEQQNAFDTDLGRFALASFNVRDEIIRQQQLHNRGWRKVDIVDVVNCLTDIKSVIRRVSVKTSAQ